MGLKTKWHIQVKMHVAIQVFMTIFCARPIPRQLELLLGRIHLCLASGQIYNLLPSEKKYLEQSAFAFTFGWLLDYQLTDTRTHDVWKVGVISKYRTVNGYNHVMVIHLFQQGRNLK